jgi:hypothetical protein
VRQASVERRIRDLQQRIRQVRGELAVLDEQIVALAEDADDATTDAAVDGSPLAARVAADATRHLEVARRASLRLRVELDRCAEERDRLLAELPASAS